MALDLGLALDVCWRHRDGPNGASDSVSSWVKSKFFKGRRFTHVAEIERQLRQWLDELNAMPPARGSGPSPRERLGDEKARLRPLKPIIPITALLSASSA